MRSPRKDWSIAAIGIFLWFSVLSKATAPAVRRFLTSLVADSNHGFPNFHGSSQNHAMSDHPNATSHSTTNSAMKKAGLVSCAAGFPTSIVLVCTGLRLPLSKVLAADDPALV